MLYRIGRALLFSTVRCLYIGAGSGAASSARRAREDRRRKGQVEPPPATWGRHHPTCPVTFQVPHYHRPCHHTYLQSSPPRRQADPTEVYPTASVAAHPRAVQPKRKKSARRPSVPRPLLFPARDARAPCVWLFAARRPRHVRAQSASAKGGGRPHRQVAQLAHMGRRPRTRVARPRALPRQRPWPYEARARWSGGGRRVARPR